MPHFMLLHVLHYELWKSKLGYKVRSVAYTEVIHFQYYIF